LCRPSAYQPVAPRRASTMSARSLPLIPVVVAFVLFCSSIVLLYCCRCVRLSLVVAGTHACHAFVFCFINRGCESGTHECHAFGVALSTVVVSTALQPDCLPGQASQSGPVAKQSPSPAPTPWGECDCHQASCGHAGQPRPGSAGLSWLVDGLVVFPAPLGRGGIRAPGTQPGDGRGGWATRITAAPHSSAQR